MNSQVQTSERRDAQARSSGDQQGRDQPFVVPPVDVFENESGITLLADLPGVSRDRLGVRVDGESLLIEATASTSGPQEMQLVYGEAQYYPTDENHPLNPTSYYGVSKLAGEKYARAFAHLYGMDTTMLRYYHVYGPRQENSDVGGVVSIFARRAMEGKPLVIFGDCTQMRSFTYV